MVGGSRIGSGLMCRLMNRRDSAAKFCVGGRGCGSRWICKVSIFPIVMLVFQVVERFNSFPCCRVFGPIIQLDNYVEFNKQSNTSVG